MADDILERLRHHDHDWLPDTHTLCDYCDALYEIERLRGEIARLGAFLHPIGMMALYRNAY